MRIILNGKIVETQETSLEGLLIEQGYVDMNIATAMNDSFLPKAERKEALLQENCVIEVVAPMQGG